MVSSDLSGWVSITKGILVVPSSDKYIFTMATDDCGLFYLSDKPLAGNPDTDAPFLLVQQHKFNYDYKKTNFSEEIFLDDSKRYYFIFVVQNLNKSTSLAEGRGSCWPQEECNKLE